MKIGNNGNLFLGPFDESTPCLMIVLMNCQTKLRINYLTAVKWVAILESCQCGNKTGQSLNLNLPQKRLGRATYPEVPNVLYTLLALTSGLIALALPETRGVDLPNTFQESESLGKSTDKVSKEDSDATSISVTEK
ncbi:alpha-2 adrenergic receptor [Trichonephila clavipes]|nr:alpha-2 adrenergic receptor [Trichonephila clavipes]